MKFFALIAAVLLSLPFSVRAQMHSKQAIVIKFRSESAIARPSSDLLSAISKISPNGFGSAARIFQKKVNGNIQSVNAIDPELARIVILPLTDNADVYQSASLVSGFSDEIEYAEPNYIYHIDQLSAPNDTLYDQQWAHRVMHVLDAWQVTQGDTSIHIGFVDTGVEWDHPDLIGQFAVNPAEDINHNGLFDAWPSTEKRLDAHGDSVFGDLDGIDNDGNGYVDDVIGYDFVDQSSINFGDAQGRDAIPQDEEPHTHGTAVAGVIAAKANNHIGVAGIAPKCRLVALRAFDATGNAEDDDIASAIVYAADNNVRILNLSFGDYVPSLLQRDAIRYATRKGLLVFASSGNEGNALPHYPSDFDECVSVGMTVLATDNVSESESAGSNHSAGMDILAPGIQIVTLFGADRYQFISGTSFSSPAAAAVAGLIWSKNPALTNIEVRSILESTTTNLDPFGFGSFAGNGRIDALKAVSYPGSAAIKITLPHTNDGLQFGDMVTIVGSTISTLFSNYVLTYSRDNWDRVTALAQVDTGMIASDTKQISGDTLGIWNTGSLVAEPYTLHLIVNSNDHRSTLENISVYLTSSAPKLTSLSSTPIYVNERHGLLIQARTDMLTTATLYFRRPGSSRWSTKKDDRLTKGHFLLLTPDDASTGIPLELKYIASNSLGDTVSGVMSGEILSESVNQRGFVQKSYSLPTGFALDTVLSTPGGNQIVENIFSDGTDFGPLKIFMFDPKTKQFKVIDSLNAPWIPRSIGNTSGDDKPELLLQAGSSYAIYKQNATHSLLGDIINADAATPTPLAVGLADVDNDGKQELVVEDTERLSATHFREIYKVFKVTGNTTSLLGKLIDTTAPAPGFADNNFNEPDASFADIGGNGKTDILTVDDDADIIGYEFDPSFPNSFKTIYQDTNSGATEGRLLTVGDFNGDGITDIALAYHSTNIDFYDLNADNEYDPSYWTVKVLLGNGNGSFTGIYNDHFYLARSRSPYRASTGRVHNVAGKKGDNLVLSLFPNFYLLQYDSSLNTMRPIWHYPLSNSPRSALDFDFDGNGKREFGFNAGDSLHFFEREDNFADQTSAPSALDAMPRDTNRVDISWGSVSGVSKYYIFRADTNNGALLFLLDSTANNYYSDTTVTNDSNYYYAIEAFDSSKKISASEPSYSAFAHVHPMPKIRVVLSHDRNISIGTTQPLSTAAIDGGVFSIDDSLICSTAIIAGTTAISATAPTDMLSSTEHSLKINSFALRDIWNSPFDTSEKFLWRPAADSIREKFYIIRWHFEGNSRIYVEFNLRPDDDALDITHYALTPFGKFFQVLRDPQNSHALYLDLVGGTNISALGTPFVLCIKDITGETNIPLEATEGNCAGETFTEPDLENVMVFPNPAKTNDETVTFARLTAEAEISIYTLDLRFLKRLKTTDKNGGVKWDMLDESGRALPSGVYWYHVTGKDDNGNDVKPKESKFVIIRNN